MRDIIYEIPRDRFGRPLVLPRDGGPKRVAYQRVTTFADVLENQRGLMTWMKRQTMYGAGQRPDLVLAASAAKADDKKLLDELAEKAMEAAQSSKGATIGTALHSLTERVDSGEPLGQVPDSAIDDIAAYQMATRGMEHLGIEQFLVHDDWRIAGTTDRVVRYQGGTYIADVKTGSIDYPGKFALQLAAYAHCQPYDIATDTRTDRDPNMDLTRALIIHLPAGKGTCRLLWIDIEKGWKACRLAREVWEWRAEKGLTWEVGPDEVPTTFTFAELVMFSTTLNELREVWRRASAEHGLTDELVKAIDHRRIQIEAGRP